MISIKDDEYLRDLTLGGQGQRADPVHHDRPRDLNQQPRGPRRSSSETRNSQVHSCVTFTNKECLNLCKNSILKDLQKKQKV